MNITVTYTLDITDKIEYTYWWHLGRNLLKYPSITPMTKKQITDLFLENDNCYYCPTKLDFGTTNNKRRKPSIDHVKPLFLGGTNDSDNLVLACYECNEKKGIKYRK